MKISVWGLGVALALASAAVSVSATEGGTGAYLLGSRDSMSGIVPPPGTYVSVDSYYLNSRVDALSLGGIVLANAHSGVFLAKVNFTRGFHGKILGGRPAITLTLPVVDGQLQFDSVIFGANRRIKDQQTGFGDLVITPGLGWDDGNNHVAFQTSVFLPIGYYKQAEVDVPNRQISALSFGKNRVAIVPVVSYTNMNPKSGLEFSASTGITFSFRNTATDFQTAPEWQAEGALLQHLKSGLAFGATGYAYQQLGEDSGAGADSLKAATGAQSLKARVFGAGPILTYSTKLGSHSLSLKGKYTKEFGARRRFEGDAAQITVAIGF